MKTIIPVFFIISIFFGIGMYSCSPTDDQKKKNDENKTEEKKETKAEDATTRLYHEAGTIKIKDAYGAIIGTSIGNNTFEISLFDIEKYLGHINGEIAAGFIMNKFILNEIFEDSIPIRGEIQFATPGYNPMVLVSSYITGAKLILNDKSIEQSDLFVDETIEPENPFQYVFIFGRKNTDRIIKVVFDKTKVLSQDKLLLMEQLEMKVKEDSITEPEKETLRNLVRTMLQNVVEMNPPKLVFTSDTTEYVFKY